MRLPLPPPPPPPREPLPRERWLAARSRARAEARKMSGGVVRGTTVKDAQDEGVVARGARTSEDDASGNGVASKAAAADDAGEGAGDMGGELRYELPTNTAWWRRCGEPNGAVNE